MKRLFAKLKSLIRHNKNSSFIIFIIIYISGYGLFFSSTSWFPSTGATKNQTALDTTLTLDNHNFTLKNWTWSKSQNLMEIEIDVNNNNYDGIDKYLFSCRDQKLKPLEVKPIVENKNLLVYHIKVTDDIKELSFRLKIDNDSKNKSFDMIRFYTNAASVEKVKKIESLTSHGYYVQRLERTILKYQNAISVHQNYINQIDNKIASANEEISTLTKTIPLLGSDDTIQTQKRIDEIKDTIEDFNNQKTEEEKNIFTIQDKIKETLKKLEQYKKNTNKEKKED